MLDPPVLMLIRAMPGKSKIGSHNVLNNNSKLYSRETRDRSSNVTFKASKEINGLSSNVKPRISRDNKESNVLSSSVKLRCSNNVKLKTNKDNSNSNNVRLRTNKGNNNNVRLRTNKDNSNNVRLRINKDNRQHSNVKLRHNNNASLRSKVEPEVPKAVIRDPNLAADLVTAVEEATKHLNINTPFSTQKTGLPKGPVFILYIIIIFAASSSYLLNPI